jgi:tetratricopeptide (TPR) repeat protein
MAAVRYFRGDRRGWLLLGDIYFASGKYRLAKDNYESGAAKYPADGELNFKLGRTLVRLNYPKEAKERLSKALALELTPEMREEARRLLQRL